MKKSIFFAALAAAVIATPSMAAVSITLSGNPTTGPQFVVGSGTSTFVLDGYLVRLGTFTDAPVVGATFAALESSFSEFGRTTIGHTTAAAPTNQGRMNRAGITGIAGGTSPADDGTFVGKTVYIWVYNALTADPTAAQGIFTSNASVNTYQDQLNALSIGLTSFVNPFGTLGGAANPTSVDKNANNAVTFFHLSAIVPEPTTTVTLGLFVALGLLRRRR